jgi:hypothetical protein
VPVHHREIYIKALRLLNLSGYKKRVRNLYWILVICVEDVASRQAQHGERPYPILLASDKVCLVST